MFVGTFCCDIVFLSDNQPFSGKDGLPFAKAYFPFFISLGSLARDDLWQPGEIIVGFWERHLIFVRLPGLTYISALPDITARQTL